MLTINQNIRILIEEAEKVTTLEVDREEHLEEIMRWARVRETFRINS